MGNLIADLFVTVKAGREDLTARSLRSLRDCTARDQFRLTVLVDGSTMLGGRPGTEEFCDIVFAKDQPDGLKAEYLLQSSENEGLGPTINRAIAHIKSVNDWYSHPTHGDPSKVAPFVVMCQDDLIYNGHWLPTLASGFLAFEKTHRLGFASGVECVEHPVRQVLTKSHVLKDWIRAAQMFGRREYWESMMPIPRLDPETGRVRAKPNDGMGSGVDWWLIRNHENSVCRTGRTNLVMPGLVVHAGYDRSTWLDRELPESESDKERMKG